jgi:hypothetical protein
MSVKLATYRTVEDFQNVAKRIIAGNKGTRTLMQNATIAALEHMKAHGNINVIMPLAAAAQSFGRNLTAAWNGYVQQHCTFLVYNKDDLRGRKLADAAPEAVWTRNPNVKPDAIDVDGANEKPWFDWRKSSAGAGDTEVNVPDAIDRFEKRMTKALIAKLAMGKDAKPVTVGTVSNMLKDMLTRIEANVLKGLKDKDAERASPNVVVAKPKARAKVTKVDLSTPKANAPSVKAA